MTHITTEIYVATKSGEREIAVDVYGDVSEGGSNAHGSDEPAWCDVSGMTVYYADTLNEVNNAMLSTLSVRAWECLTDEIVEAYRTHG